MADGAIVDVHNIRAAGERLVEMLADSASSTPLQLQTQVGSKPWTVAGIAAVFKCRVVPFVEDRQSAQSMLDQPGGDGIRVRSMLKPSFAFQMQVVELLQGTAPVLDRGQSAWGRVQQLLQASAQQVGFFVPRVPQITLPADTRLRLW